MMENPRILLVSKLLSKATSARIIKIRRFLITYYGTEGMIMDQGLSYNNALAVKNLERKKYKTIWRKKAREVAEDIAKNLISALEKEIKAGRVHRGGHLHVQKEYCYKKPFDHARFNDHKDYEYFYDFCDIYEDEGEKLRHKLVPETIKKHFAPHGWKKVEYWERIFSDYNSRIYVVTIQLSVT